MTAAELHNLEIETLGEITTIKTAISETITNGQSLSVTGGIAVTRAPLPELRKQLAIARRRLLYLRGQGTYTVPNYAGYNYYGSLNP